ncbi:MAG: CehA/McbA family metallohydrolase [Pseudomonadales bacterium]
MDVTNLIPNQQHKVDCHITQVDKHASPFLEIPFHLPANVTRLDVSYEYITSNDCVLDIGLLDCSATAYPTRSGFRGWSGGARSSFFVATDAATPGYVAGPLPAGEWTLLLGLYKVPAEGVDVSLILTTDEAPRGVISLAEVASPRRQAMGWYRGDLHCHTFHSDARGSPDTLAQNARIQGLDFLAVTDHNTTTQWEYFGSASTEELVFIPGMEVTTYRGHANIFGLTEWIDFRLGGSADLRALVDEARRQGALLSINHDKEPLPWSYQYPAIDCLEVFHSHWLSGNDGILKRYDHLLAQGHRISLIGGSDYHQPEQLQPEGPFGLGKPTTVLWLPHLDIASVIDGLRLGHGYVTESPLGPHISFKANDQPMGSVIHAADSIDIELDVKRAAGDRLVWISDQGSIDEKVIPTDDWQCSLEIPTPQKFLRAEIVAERSRDRIIEELVRWYETKKDAHRSQQPLTAPPPIRRALSNPVYFS